MKERNQSEILQELALPLVNWYQSSCRILRWRSEPKPYYIWLSEIMLQQTRVEAVKAYFDRFVEVLPDIGSLAVCEEDRLLKLWEGLGYYNRVRNLQKAAILVMEQFGGELPGDYEKLLSLPGIGSYTAGAVASIAFGIPVPAVDGNVLRVIARLTASTEDIKDPAVKKRLEQALKKVMPKESPGDFNQALMELGAVVCLPGGKPLCGQCPIMHLCRAFHEEKEEQIPVKTAKKPRKTEEKTIFVLCFNEDGTYRYAIRRRPAKGLLAGLWELPNTDGYMKEEGAARQAADWCGIESSGLTVIRLQEAKHIFTHREWRMQGYAVLLQNGFPGGEEKVQPGNAGAAEWIWASEEEIRSVYPLPSAFSVYLNYILNQKRGNRNEETVQISEIL